ncbi:MAG: hypothetical protein ABIL01_20845 [Pseudomonadota bacterium]
MDMPTKMLQFPQFGLVERGADAEATYRAIGTGMPIQVACNQGNPHASLQDGTGGHHMGRRLYLNGSSICRLIQIKNRRSWGSIKACPP